ncbi:hypothetical protein [Bradyrhizobium genosp. A]|uniref:hypothetical protein n=1 Tax=Bradyrhizobium genosp. A TaxID=83626 RepID=UPI003CE6C3A8
MVTEPTKKASRKVKRRRKLTEEIIDYIVYIENWNFTYWLAINTLRNALDPYHEHRHVEIKGRLLRPTGLKTDHMEVSLFPSISLEEERRKVLKPIAVGAIETYPERLVASLSIPSDALRPILQMLIAGRLKFVVMRGSKFRYRSARLHSYSLGTKLEEDEDPEVIPGPQG